MDRGKAQIKRRPILVSSMLLIAGSCIFFLKFDLAIVLGVTIVAVLVFGSIGERLVKYQDDKKPSDLHLSWGVGFITALTIAIYFIERGSYVTNQRYIYWIGQILKGKFIHVDLQIGTLIFLHYIIFLSIYGKVTWRIAKKNIAEWIPDFWCVLSGIGIMLYIKERSNHLVRTMSVLIIGTLLIGYLIFRYIANREQRIVYHISVKRYLITLGTCLLIVIGIGVSLPQHQELIGARWIRNLTSILGNNVDLQSKIPLESHLNHDFNLSDAVLFEVDASETLYLRDIAYKHYEEGVWSIPTRNEEMDSYIALKPQYLQAEYLQTQSLLDEMAYQNSQNKALFFKYAEIASYESSVSNKKRYTIIQNPINKINYFTVNGVTDIKDENSSVIYYYQNINSCYFHGEKLIEPSNYTVEYYDHVPKMGSREYMFLRSMNTIRWENIYRQIVKNRTRYDYYYDDIPKLLLTYTPMVQYKNAKKNFLQVPKELKEPLRAMAKTITLSEHSDWTNAEAICQYLREQYTYCLHSEQKDEGEYIYNFLFHSKEGVCQDFASSMALLCRSIGIPARYVTGYLVTEKNSETGRYIVREKDAHAFVEVYIAGYGWMTFDPTPAMEADEAKEIEKVEWGQDSFIKMIATLVLLIIGAVIYKDGFIYFQEIIWKGYFIFLKPSVQIEQMTKRTIKWLKHVGYNREKHETLSQYAERLSENHIDIKEIIQAYEGYRYGLKIPDKNKLISAYKQYNELKNQLKKK